MICCMSLSTSYSIMYDMSGKEGMGCKFSLLVSFFLPPSREFDQV